MFLSVDSMCCYHFIGSFRLCHYVVIDFFITLEYFVESVGNLTLTSERIVIGRRRVTGLCLCKVIGSSVTFDIEIDSVANIWYYP